MEHLAAILQAIASLAWVAFAFTGLIMFKPEITRALVSLKRGKFFGQEVEFELDMLAKSAAATAKEVLELPTDVCSVEGTVQDDELDATIKSIIREAARSPKVALMTLSAELERQTIRGLATRGMLRGRPFVPLGHAFNELRQYGLPPNLQGSLELFSGVRNKVIHGGTATDDDALRALDSGMTILRALNALPNEINVVDHPGVEVFSNAECTELIPDIKGIIMETTSPGGVTKTKNIYATTRTGFQKGKRLTWEWNTGRGWGPAWYRDPETGEIKSAWGASAEFIGRHLDEIPG